MNIIIIIVKHPKLQEINIVLILVDGYYLLCILDTVIG